MAKNRNDWAIIVGVQVYPAPEIDDLGGPQNDALAFRRWVISPRGGNVLAKNVCTILSSDYKQPFENTRKARPTAKRILHEFEKLQAISEENVDQGLGPKIGRRLYLYFAGHGCAPLNPELRDEALLLAANASSTSLGENIPGKAYADKHRWEAYFDEIVLFMDCCREVLHKAPYLPPNIGFSNDALNVKIFYGFATKWSQKAREKPFNGQVKGLFTTLLLDGLNGAAANPHDGRVTVRSLKAYIYNSWKQYLTPEELTSLEVPKEPDLQFLPDNELVEEAFVFAEVDVPEFPVTIEFSSDLVGSDVKILDHDFQVETETTITPDPWRVELKKGKYLLDPEEGQALRFDVIGLGEKHVRYEAE